MEKTEVEHTITTKVTQAAQEVADNPKVAVDYSAVPAIVNAVLDNIIPIIRHSTSTEPWWRSRVFWSAIMGVLAGVLGIFGVAFPAEMQASYLNIIMALVPLVAAGLALWGRYAKKPLGTPDK